MNTVTNFLPYVIDAVCLVILLLFISAGWRTGFASKALKLCSMLLAVLITYFVYSRVASWLCEMGMADAIASRISFKQSDAETSEQTLLAGLSIPAFLKTQLSANNTPSMNELLGTSTLMDYVRVYLARVLVNVVAIVATFIVSLILLNFVAKKLKHIRKIPLIGTVNSLLGAAAMLAVGIAILWIAMLTLTFLCARHAELTVLTEAIDESLLASRLQKVNLFAGWAIRL